MGRQVLPPQIVVELALAAAAEHLAKQLLLAAEIAAHQSDIDTDLAGDVAQADILVAVAEEAAARRGQHRLARRLGAFPALRMMISAKVMGGDPNSRADLNQRLLTFYVYGC